MIKRKKLYKIGPWRAWESTLTGSGAPDARCRRMMSPATLRRLSKLASLPKRRYRSHAVLISTL